jgi:hypothetical protein
MLHLSYIAFSITLYTNAVYELFGPTKCLGQLCLLLSYNVIILLLLEYNLRSDWMGCFFHVINTKTDIE